MASDKDMSKLIESLRLPTVSTLSTSEVNIDETKVSIQPHLSNKTPLRNRIKPKIGGPEEELREACGVFGCVLARDNRNLVNNFSETSELNNQVKVESSSSDNSPYNSSNNSADELYYTGPNVNIAKVIHLGLVALQHR